MHLVKSGFSIYCGVQFTNNTLINTMLTYIETPKTLDPYFFDYFNTQNRWPNLPPNCTSNEFGKPSFTHNIVYDSPPNKNFTSEFGLIILHLYDLDEIYELYIEEKHLDMDYNNYYFTDKNILTDPYTVSFFIGGGEGRDQYGRNYSLNQWQTDTTSKPYTYDVHSIVEDPLLKTDDGSFIPQNPNAMDKGWLAGTTTEVIWDVDGDKKWSLPDIIYGLEVLSGKRK